VQSVARTLKRDRVLFATTLVLLTISVTMVYSASVALNEPFLMKQSLAIALGLVAMAVAMKLD
jgi:cell division protein FtsW (lipid II flippase)